MADEKTVAKTKETEKASFGTKFVNFFKRLPGKIATPFKNMWHELKKVTWPGPKEVVKYSAVVFVFMLIMGVIIGLIDFGSGALINLIVKL